MAEDRMQLQRFELKYRIRAEETALAVRDFLTSYLEVDEFGATLPRFSYPVHSLYLDSPTMQLYWDTINGSKNRYKLRLRFYENRPDAPVYFEIKRRMNNIIAKQRGGVRREAVDPLLAGQLPEPAHLVSRDPKHLVSLQNFNHLMNCLEARPRTHVAYWREAWLSPIDNSVRVTLDREVRTEVEPTGWLSTQMRNPIYVFGSDIILELKFTSRFPNWFGDLVRHFGLRQSGAAKYVEGVAQLGVERVSRAFALEGTA
jgi:SPX domain protein involved in polyphosphate accumulation